MACDSGECNLYALDGILRKGHPWDHTKFILASREIAKEKSSGRYDSTLMTNIVLLLNTFESNFHYVSFSYNVTNFLLVGRQSAWKSVFNGNNLEKH